MEAHTDLCGAFDTIVQSRAIRIKIEMIALDVVQPLESNSAIAVWVDIRIISGVSVDQIG
jgi:hypothetical protein